VNSAKIGGSVGLAYTFGENRGNVKFIPK